MNDAVYREILGVAEGSREDKESRSNFLRYLKDRGLKGVKLIVSVNVWGCMRLLEISFPQQSGNGALYTAIEMLSPYMSVETYPGGCRHPESNSCPR